jgi:hypothetical protein
VRVGGSRPAAAPRTGTTPGGAAGTHLLSVSPGITQPCSLVGTRALEAVGEVGLGVQLRSERLHLGLQVVQLFDHLLHFPLHEKRNQRKMSNLKPKATEEISLRRRVASARRRALEGMR